MYIAYSISICGRPFIWIPKAPITILWPEGVYKQKNLTRIFIRPIIFQNDQNYPRLLLLQPDCCTMCRTWVPEILFLGDEISLACFIGCPTGYTCVSDQCCTTVPSTLPPTIPTVPTIPTTVATTTISTCQNIASNCASLSYLCNNATYYVCCSLLLISLLTIYR